MATRQGRAAGPARRPRRGAAGHRRADHVLTDADLTAGYEVDWTGRFRGPAAAVVRPGHDRRGRRRGRRVRGARRRRSSPRAATPAWSAAACPSARRAGASASCAARPARRRRRRRRPGDRRRRRHAGPLQHHVGAARPGLRRRPRAAGLGTVGGMIATNAGGIHVVRYGTMRAQVLGVEAVLGDGSVVSPPRRPGEGQHRLRPGRPADRQRGHARRRHRGAAAAGAPPRPHRVPWCWPPCRRWPRRWPWPPRCARRLAGLDAVERCWPTGVALVADKLGLDRRRCRPRAPAALIVEVGRPRRPAGGAGRRGRPGSTCRPSRWSPPTPAAPAAVAAAGGASPTPSPASARPHKLDVDAARRRAWRRSSASCPTSLPAGARGRPVRPPRRRQPPRQHHRGGAADDEAAVDEAVLRLVVGHGGSISRRARHRHGQGAAGSSLCRSPAEIAAFRAIKAALDPAGILNPGVLLPPG